MQRRTPGPAGVEWLGRIRLGPLGTVLKSRDWKLEKQKIVDANEKLVKELKIDACIKPI